jgi:hypothetical protein
MQKKLKTDQVFMSLMPPLSEEEFRQLEESILSEGGCRDPIVTWRGLIIDGHNRYGICMHHGIAFETVPINFNGYYEAILWVIENQMGRRNLTDAMRIELASRKLEMLRLKAKDNLYHTGGGKENGRIPVPEPVNLRKAIAGEAGVSEWKVQKYIAIKKLGDAQLLDQVKRGEKTIGAAANQAMEVVTTVIREIPVDTELFRNTPVVIEAVLERTGHAEKLYNDLIAGRPGNAFPNAKSGFIKLVKKHTGMISELMGKVGEA